MLKKSNIQHLSVTHTLDLGLKHVRILQIIHVTSTALQTATYYWVLDFFFILFGP